MVKTSASLLALVFLVGAGRPNVPSTQPVTQNTLAQLRSTLTAVESAVLTNLDSDPKFEAARKSMGNAQATLDATREKGNQDSLLEENRNGLPDADRQNLLDASSAFGKAKDRVDDLRRSALMHDAAAIGLRKRISEVEKELEPLTFDKLLKNLPKAAQPPWDEFSMPKAHKWMNEQIAGDDFQIAVGIKAASLIRIPDPTNPDETSEWDISLTTDCVEDDAFGIDELVWPTMYIATDYFDSNLGWQPLEIPGHSHFSDNQLRKTARGGVLLIKVSEDEAKAARNWSSGDTVVLAGTLENLDILHDAPLGRFNAIFKDVRIVKVMPKPIPGPQAFFQKKSQE
jgi:hypothetical protein